MRIIKYFLIVVIIVIITQTILNLSKGRHKEINQTVYNAVSPTLSVLSSNTIEQRVKTTNCIAANSLPDPACTPGTIIPTATKDEICTPGYSKSVRFVPRDVKKAVYAEYGILTHSPGQYEVDHLISLELGGSNDIANLWPEAADPRPGFHEKDRFENFAHQQVCNGIISLQQAQNEISTDWLKYWQEAGQP